MADRGRLYVRVGRAALLPKDWVVAQALSLRLFAVVAGRMCLVALRKAKDVNRLFVRQATGTNRRREV